VYQGVPKSTEYQATTSLFGIGRKAALVLRPTNDDNGFDLFHTVGFRINPGFLAAAS